MSREVRVNDLVERVQGYHPTADVETIRRAYDFSAEVHKGQRRLSGEPYLIHPMAVAGIIADLKLDVPSIVAGLLHDTVEDTLTSLAHPAFTEPPGAPWNGTSETVMMSF